MELIGGAGSARWNVECHRSTMAMEFGKIGYD